MRRTETTAAPAPETRRVRFGATLTAVVRDGTRNALRGYFVPVIALWRLFERQHEALEPAHRLRARKAGR